MSGTKGPRTRVSPIIVGLAAIGVLVLGTESYLLFRPHRRSASMVAARVSADDSEPAAHPDPAPPIPPLPIAGAPAVAAPRPPSPEAPHPSATVPAEPPPVEVQSAAVKKRALMMAGHNHRVVLEADERAFETLQLTDATRTAIRQINAGYVKTTRDSIEANAAWSPGEQLGANVAKNDESDRARRAALKDLLGADGVSAFETAEYAAARRLRRQYSAQWAKELEEQAPLPEGLPPSPH